MPQYAYQRRLVSGDKNLLIQVNAKAFSNRGTRCFVQIYKNEKYLDANELKLKKSYTEEDLEKEGYTVEACTLVCKKKGANYFTKGVGGQTGTTRWLYKGKQCPKALKKPASVLAYAVTDNTVTNDKRLRFLHFFERLTLDTAEEAQSLIEGVILYIDKYVMPFENSHRTETFIQDYREEVESIIFSKASRYGGKE